MCAPQIFNRLSGFIWPQTNIINSVMKQGDCKFCDLIIKYKFCDPVGLGFQEIPRSVNTLDILLIKRVIK